MCPFHPSFPHWSLFAQPWLLPSTTTTIFIVPSKGRRQCPLCSLLSASLCSAVFKSSLGSEEDAHKSIGSVARLGDRGFWVCLVPIASSLPLRNPTRPLILHFLGNEHAVLTQLEVGGLEYPWFKEYGEVFRKGAFLGVSTLRHHSFIWNDRR